MAATGLEGAAAAQPDFTMMNAEEKPQMQLPMVQQPGLDPQSGMMAGANAENAAAMMQPMGMDPSMMMQPQQALKIQDEVEVWIIFADGQKQSITLTVRP